MRTTVTITAFLFLCFMLVAGAWFFMRVRSADAQELDSRAREIQARDEKLEEVNRSSIAKPVNRQDGFTVEVARPDEARTVDQRAVVKVVLVFYKDLSRRAIEGVMFDTGRGETWVVMASTATLVPKDSVPAIDRMYVEGAAAGAIEGEFVQGVEDLGFCRIPRLLPTYDLAQPSDSLPKLAIDDEVTGLNTAVINGKFLREPTKVRVRGLNMSVDELLLDGKGARRSYRGLIELNGSLPEGTPIFKDGRLVGIVNLGRRFISDRKDQSFAIPIDRIREGCRRAVAQAVMEESLKKVRSGRPIAAGNELTEDPDESRPATPSSKPPSNVSVTNQTPIRGTDPTRPPVNVPATEGGIAFTDRPADAAEAPSANSLKLPGSSKPVPTANGAEFEEAPSPFPHLNIKREIIPVGQLDVDEAAKSLKSLFADDPQGTGIVRIAGNTGTRTIIVSAPADTLDEMRKVIAQLTDELERSTRTGLPRPNAQGAGTADNKPLLPRRDDQDIIFDIQSKVLAKQIRTSSEAEKRQLRPKLDDMVRRHFEHRQQKRKQEIDDLAHRIDQMKVAQAHRDEQQAEIIKRHIAELLEEDTDLKWDETQGGGTGNSENKGPTPKTGAAPVSPDDKGPTGAAIGSPPVKVDAPAPSNDVPMTAKP